MLTAAAQYRVLPRTAGPVASLLRLERWQQGFVNTQPPEHRDVEIRAIFNCSGTMNDRAAQRLRYGSSKRFG